RRGGRGGRGRAWSGRVAACRSRGGYAPGMHPKIVERGAFHVVGMRRRFAAGNMDGMFEMWGSFADRQVEISGKDPDVVYGIVVDDSKPGDLGYVYYACAETKSPGRVPQGMAEF